MCIGGGGGGGLRRRCRLLSVNRGKNDRPCQGDEVALMSEAETMCRAIDYSVVSGLKKGVTVLKKGVS